MLKWRDEFSVNINSIDTQHKKLIEIGNRIDELLSLNDDADHYDEIMAIMGELKEYTIYHFDFEEKLLGENQYEALQEHHFEHYFFIKKLDRIGSRDIDDDQEKTIAEIYSFVIGWITDHILKSDMKYSQFLNSRGIY